MPEKGRQLDLTSGVTLVAGMKEMTDPERRRFLGVHFACCDVYSRVYANRDLSAYVGHCPRCAKRVQFEVGPGGTDSRFFTAY